MKTAFIACLFTSFVLGGFQPSPATADDDDARVDVAVERGLKFLASQQQTSGAWRHRIYGESPSVTALAALAFLAAGHVPGEGPYGTTLDRAIDWVLLQQKRVEVGKGKDTILFQSKRASHGPMYEHGICTLMLASAVNLLPRERADRCRATLIKAVRLIVRAQAIPKAERHSGGWRYQPTSPDSDLTVTGCQMAALKAADLAGFDVPKETFDAAVNYVKQTQNNRGGKGGFAYQPHGAPTATRSGIGVFCLALAGKPKSKAAITGAKFILSRPLRASDSYAFYGCYYCTAAMRQLGGEYWSTQRRATHSVLLNSQDANGSWAKGFRGAPRRHGTSYTTSFAVLTLALERGHLRLYRP